MLTLYIIWDTKANMPAQAPFLTHNDVVATRSFTDMMSEENSYMAKHADDYELRKLGELEEHGGIGENPCATIITARQVLTAQDANTRPMGVIS